MRITTVAAALALTAIATASASALTFDQVNVESWTGNAGAANKAVMVVDFGPQSFAFGYSWNGAATGFDMLSDVAAATDLDMSYNIQYGGPVVNSLTYHGYSLTYDSLNWGYDDHWWEYWTATNGEDFASSWVGCGDRSLANNSWDGWGWSPVYPAVGIAPDVPVVPEPASWAVLASALGALGLKLKRR